MSAVIEKWVDRKSSLHIAAILHVRSYAELFPHCHLILACVMMCTSDWNDRLLMMLTKDTLSSFRNCQYNHK